MGEFQPEFAGKMNFYLAAVDDKLQTEGDNPSIGLILCRGKNGLIVEYALRDLNKPMVVSEYTVLPPSIANALLSPDVLEAGLEDHLDGPDAGDGSDSCQADLAAASSEACGKAAPDACPRGRRFSSRWRSLPLPPPSSLPVAMSRSASPCRLGSEQGHGCPPTPYSVMNACKRVPRIPLAGSQSHVAAPHAELGSRRMIETQLSTDSAGPLRQRR